MNQVIDLNGRWDFVVDLDPKYHNNPEYANPSWDRTNWQKVTVPGVWNHYAERYSIYEGVCWFSREFFVETLSETATCILRFAGVNYKCEIFINGKQAGEHEGGYTEFVIDVSGLINKGKNHIAIKVDNRAVYMRLPPVLGYFNYGGIHRDVTLEIYEGKFLDDMFIDAKSDGTLLVKGEVCGSVQTKIYKTELEIICNHNTNRIQIQNNRFEVYIKIPDIIQWFPEEPNLYPVKISLYVNEQLQDKKLFNIGFRTVCLKQDGFYLNGKKLFLKGINYLYDSPEYGLVMKKEQFKLDIALLKEIGINAIRSHLVFTDELLSEFDRQGIMVWIEPPIYCINPTSQTLNSVFSDTSFQQLAVSMLEEMIIQSRNHPSVIIYGIGNECNAEHPEAEKFFRRLVTKAKELDTTRLIGYAALYQNIGPLAELVDILGINQYYGWYDIINLAKVDTIDLKVLDDKLIEITNKYGKPLLMTEFGADSIPGYLSESLQLWSENYHSELLKKSFEIFKQHNQICGTFPFGFSDYRDPSKYVNKYWDEMNYKGVVTYERKKKLPFFTLKEIYHGGDLK